MQQGWGAEFSGPENGGPKRAKTEKSWAGK